MWEALMEALSGLGGSLGEGAGSLWDSAGGALGQLGQGISQNPWGALGAGVQGAGALMPYFMGQGDQQGMGGMDPTSMQQMQQPGMLSQAQVKRNIGDQASRGLSGASPDFTASMAGMTPDELSQMLGYNPNGQGAV